ncbi:hypothetical protein ACFL54_06285 [Planctomycetota bacterium]
MIDKKILTAVHEAAHGVIAQKSGLEIDYLALNQNSDSICQGFFKDCDPTKMALVTLSGWAAVAKYRDANFNDYPFADDKALLQNLITDHRRRFGSGTEENVVSGLKLQAKKLVINNWADIQFVAARLFSDRFLTGSQVEMAMLDRQFIIQKIKLKPIQQQALDRKNRQTALRKKNLETARKWKLLKNTITS